MISNDKIIKETENLLAEEIGAFIPYGKLCGELKLEEVFTTTTVFLAAHHCACGFRGRMDTFSFMQAPWVHSRELCLQVLEGTFRPRYYKEKAIVERGKKRTIKPPVFTCKVVQKVLCDAILRPLLEPRMIFDNYAGVRGRGTSHMYERIERMLNRDGKQGDYIIRTDFTNFFASIDNAILERMLGSHLTDKRILRLFRLFCPEEKGLSLGNESSQISASFYPSVIDHHFKDMIGCRNYYRYADDILLLAEDSAAAEVYVKKIRMLAESLGLFIKDEKIQICSFGDDFVFCKERFLWNREKKYYYRIMNPMIAKNETRKLKAFRKKYLDGQMTKEQITLQFQGVLGTIAKHPNTYQTVKRLQRQYEAVCLPDTSRQSPERPVGE